MLYDHRRRWDGHHHWLRHSDCWERIPIPPTPLEKCWKRKHDGRVCCIWCHLQERRHTPPVEQLAAISSYPACQASCACDDLWDPGTMHTTHFLQLCVLTEPIVSTSMIIDEFRKVLLAIHRHFFPAFHHRFIRLCETQILLGGRETGLIHLVHFQFKAISRALRASKLRVTWFPLTTGRKNGVGWPSKIMGNSSMEACLMHHGPEGGGGTLIFKPYIDLISRSRENTGDYFPSLHIDRGAAEVNMAREIIKPVFSRPREIRVLSQEDWFAHHWLVLLLKKCETKASCLCSERYNASTGSPWPSGQKWFDRLFSTCNRQLADSPGG